MRRESFAIWITLSACVVCAHAMEHRIGGWNGRDDMDGWQAGTTKPAVHIRAVRDAGSEGRGCLLVQTSPDWSQAAETAEGRHYVQHGDIVRFDVLARSVDFPSGPVEVGIAVQSEQTVFDEYPMQEVEFGRWQTLSFEYDRAKHSKSSWTKLVILTKARDSGVLLIDNVRIEK